MSNIDQQSDWEQDGADGERLLEEQARVEGLVVAPIPQDHDSFELFNDPVSMIVKRPDGVIINTRHKVVVEVKTLTAYRLPNGGYCYYLLEDQIARLELFARAFNCAVVLCIYQRNRKGGIHKDRLRQIELGELVTWMKSHRKAPWRKKTGLGWCVRVPLKVLTPDFEVLHGITGIPKKEAA